MSCEKSLKELRQILIDNSSEAVQTSAKKFVPHIQKVYGVRVPILNDLAKKYQEDGFELVEQLWESEALEEQLLAAKILGKISKKEPDRALELLKRFSKKITNWAVCDTLGMQSIKPLLKIKQAEIINLAKTYVKSENLWERRLSLVLVEHYAKKNELPELINQLVKELENDQEYYVKKAVTWIKNNLTKRKS